MIDYDVSVKSIAAPAIHSSLRPLPTSFKAYRRRSRRAQSGCTRRRRRRFTGRSRRGGGRHRRHPQVQQGGAPVVVDRLRGHRQEQRHSCQSLFSETLTYQV